MRFNLNGFHTLNIYQNALSFGYFLGVHKLMHTHIHDHYFFYQSAAHCNALCEAKKRGKSEKHPKTHTHKKQQLIIYQKIYIIIIIIGKLHWRNSLNRNLVDAT